MKVKILLIFGLVLGLTAPPAAQATSIAIGNFNADEIFENSSPSFAPDDVDASGAYWAETGYSGIGSGTGLPASSFTSATGSGVQYQLQAYTGNNALRLDSATPTGNLDVIDGQYAQLHILAASGNAGASNTSDITLKFSDSTISTYFNKLNAPDWYENVSGTTTAAITGLTRVAPSTPSPFAMYETVLSLTADDQLKTLMSIDFNLASGARVTSIYAVDGTPVPLPGALILLGTGLVWLATYAPKKRTLS
jgi:hypothetical protein